MNQLKIKSKKAHIGAFFLEYSNQDDNTIKHGQTTN